MFKIKTVSAEEATGQIAEVYGKFPPHMGIPAAFQMLSASPPLMAAQLQMMGFWNDHETFGDQAQTAMRMLISAHNELSACRDFNGKYLMMLGLDENQVAAFSGPVEGWPLDEKSNALIRFVVEHVTRRKPAAEEDLDYLRKLGWSDQEIFEGISYGGMVMGITSVTVVLKK